ncbi:hypothetical protein O6H91_14G043700 [Diphasiastrum complanatum]|nr:hypothetical protein O6H91_Y357800 [Diphasiastrum complanatum]KAJ7531428.1 hypothetical protein O6H91_14G043700 [Diphasiastrum complanatum]
MEDAVAVCPALVSLPCYAVGGCKCDCPHAPGIKCSLHFFGVYDGHGGSQAALFCKDRLHVALVEELKAVSYFDSFPPESVNDWELQWEKIMLSCFRKVDSEVGGGVCIGEDCDRCAGNGSCAEPIAPETVGSTAIVAVVSSFQIIVANCGDSRAVLSRGGKVIALSADHKPDREDEMARVEAAGGRVIFWDGYRILGVLAMSRAIGDRYLKPSVIADPEVKCVQRAEDDEFLILATDGLWDVLSNEAACDVTRKCIAGRCNHNSIDGLPPTRRGRGSDDSPASAAATLLTKLALARGSKDNISVVVVDLKGKQK